MSAERPAVAIIMGSRSDWPTLRCAAESLEALGVPYEAKVISAHRTVDRMVAFAKGAEAAGVKVIIAGAGGAAHLPGMTASLTTLPVLGVGLALILRPKAVLLAAAAGLVASGARLHTREVFVVIVCYVAIATSTVVVPIVAATLFPDRVRPRLDAAKGWITTHSAGVSATISTLIGAFLIAVGLGI